MTLEDEIRTDVVRAIYEAKVIRRGTYECWGWKGHLGNGYGQVTVNRRQIGAHRVSHILNGGCQLPGQHIDHLCRNRECTNPLHLEAVSEAENLLRGIGPTAVNARKTHCKRGHSLSGDNLYIYKNTGYRQCITCREMKRRERIKAAREATSKEQSND